MPPLGGSRSRGARWRASASDLAFARDEYPSQDDIVAILLFVARCPSRTSRRGGQALMAAVILSS